MSKLDYSRHHTIPRSRGGSDHKINIDRIKNRKHEAIHALFDNLVTSEKILKILDMDGDVLRDEPMDEIRRVVESVESCLYRPKAIKSKGGIILPRKI